MQSHRSSAASAGSPRRLMVLAAFLLVAASLAAAQRVDCRRFVFAPICRGVAAKRSAGGGPAVRFLHSALHRSVGEEAAADLDESYATPAPEVEDRPVHQRAARLHHTKAGRVLWPRLMHAPADYVY